MARRAERNSAIAKEDSAIAKEDSAIAKDIATQANDKSDAALKLAGASRQHLCLSATCVGALIYPVFSIYQATEDPIAYWSFIGLALFTAVLLFALFGTLFRPVPGHWTNQE
jgi:hypothetical protein